MPDRNWKAGETFAAGLAVLVVMTAILSVVPIPLAAQDAGGTITVLYGSGSKVSVRDWHFVYEYLESDMPLDPAFVATCRMPSSESSCFTQVRTAKDLFVVAPLPGPSAAAQVPFILPESALQAIFLHWKESPGPYEPDGVTLNRNRGDGRYTSDGVTIVTTQGARIRIAGGLRAPEAFLSQKRYVYLMKFSLAGSVQVQGAPGRFELRLDSALAPSSLKERVEEIQFRLETETDRAGF